MQQTTTRQSMQCAGAVFMIEPASFAFNEQTAASNAMQRPQDTRSEKAFQAPPQALHSERAASTRTALRAGCPAGAAMALEAAVCSLRQGCRFNHEHRARALHGLASRGLLHLAQEVCQQARTF